MRATIDAVGSRAYFVLAVESRPADAQQECGGQLVSSDFPQGVHEGDAALERSPGVFHFFQLSFLGETTDIMFTKTVLGIQYS